MADSPATARAVADAGSPDVAASVNYSLLLDDSVQAWVEAAAVHDWVSARVVTTNDVLLTDSPFSASPWRRAENAGLWDLGPHSISFLATVLGPIAAVRAESTDGIITVSCDHVSGQRSEAVCSIASESSETSFEFVDADGRSEAPAFSFDAARAYANALTVLLTGPATLCQRVVADLGFSAQVVAVIAAATTSLAEAGRVVRVDDPA